MTIDFTAFETPGAKARRLAMEAEGDALEAACVETARKSLATRKALTEIREGRDALEVQAAAYMARAEVPPDRQARVGEALAFARARALHELAAAEADFLRLREELEALGVVPLASDEMED